MSDGGGDGHNESGWGNHSHDSDDSRGKAKCSKGCKLCAMIAGGIISFAFIIGGGGLLSSGIDKSNNFSETMGTIIGRRSCGTSGNNDGETFGAIIEYEVQNTTYTIEPSTCTNPGPTVGNEIRVLYDPDDPQEGVDGSWVGLYLAPTILLVIGIPVFLTITVLCCIAGSKKFSGRDKPVNTFGAITVIGDSPMNNVAPSPPVKSSANIVKPVMYSNAVPHTEVVAPTAPPPYNPDYATVTPPSQAYPVVNNNNQSGQSQPVSLFDQLKATT